MADRKTSKRSRRAKGDGRKPPAPVGKKADADPAAAPGGESGPDAGTICEIAAREASGIEGVAELTGGWRSKGVRVTGPDGENGGCVVDLSLAVEYGVDCVALAEAVRGRVAEAIHRAAGREVSAVNVHLTGIRDRGSPEEPHDQGSALDREDGIDF